VDGANPGVKSVYNAISKSLANYSTVPSFASAIASKAETYEMKYSDGKYTLTLTDSKYETQKSQTVKVESGKTATVTFENVLKKGSLEVVKTSDDNFNEGVEFHLYGTSLSGASIDLYATTNADGVAKFENVLVSGDKPYTLEEVNTADRYVVPKTQRVVIEWNKVTKKRLKTKLFVAQLKD
jgi:hypothetical protein